MPTIQQLVRSRRIQIKKKKISEPIAAVERQLLGSAIDHATKVLSDVSNKMNMGSRNILFIQNHNF